MRAAAVLHVPRSRHSSVVIGYERLAQRMREQGHTLEIVTPQDLMPRGVSVRLLPVVLPVLVRRWLAPRADLDAVIFHSYTGWLARRPRPGVAFAVAFHGFEPLFHAALDAETRRRGQRLNARYAVMYGRLMPRMLRRACRRADAVICLNGAEREALIDGGYAPPEKIHMAWHDAPDELFVPRVYRPRAVTLLAVMQWLPTKGTAYLVAAFSALARRHPDLRLIVAGSLADAGAVRAEFPEDVRGRVDVLPRFEHADHAARLAGVDLLVHPSLSEGFSQAVIEGMAAGLPIVTTRTGFAIDRLADDVDALIVPPADAASLERAVDGLLDDQPRRARLGRAAQAHADRLRAADSKRTVVNLLESLVARA